MGKPFVSNEDESIALFDNKKIFDKLVLVPFVFGIGVYPFRLGAKTKINQLQDRCLTDVVPSLFAAYNACFVNNEVKTWVKSDVTNYGAIPTTYVQ